MACPMTKLTGRYIEFEMFTLSFSEFLAMKEFLGVEAKDDRTEFEEYYRYGGSPRSLEYDDVEAKAHYIEDVVRQIGKLECDFIARSHDLYAYIQVSMTIADCDVEEREYRPFSHIRDGYPRYLFTLDPLLQRREGVRHLNLIDFMKNDEDLQ